MNSIGLSNMFSQDTYDRIFGNKTIELEQYLQGKATDSCDEATRLFMAIEKSLEIASSMAPLIALGLCVAMPLLLVLKQSQIKSFLIKKKDQYLHVLWL